MQGKGRRKGRHGSRDIEDRRARGRKGLQVGDDTVQRNAGRVPQPRTFTHGPADQRERRFQAGFKSGEVASCDTFRAARL